MNITITVEHSQSQNPDQALIAAAKPIRDILGRAEWSSPEEAEQILKRLIDYHWLALSNALSPSTPS